MELSIGLTDKSIEKQKIRVTKTHKGLFIRLGCAKVVDLVIGYSFKYKKFVYDKHYRDCTFLQYLKYALSKGGFISILKYY